MARLQNNNDFGDQGLQFQFDEVIAHCKHLKTEYLYDTIANEHFDWIIKKLNNLKIQSLTHPRYKWQIIQSDIDVLYKEANGLISGYIINIRLDKNLIYCPGKLDYHITELKFTA